MDFRLYKCHMAIQSLSLEESFARSHIAKRAFTTAAGPEAKGTTHGFSHIAFGGIKYKSTQLLKLFIPLSRAALANLRINLRLVVTK